MFKKIKKILFLSSFILSISFITKYYFSEQNIIFTNKSRTSNLSLSIDNRNNLPTLKNNTNNIIVYMDDLEDFKNKRKKRSWENLISNKNDE